MEPSAVIRNASAIDGARLHRPAGEDRDDQRREQRADPVGGPAAPAHLGTDEPDGHAHQRADREAVRERAAPVDPGRVVHGPGQDQAQGGDEHEDDPALLGTVHGEPAAAHHANASARDLCGSRTTVAIWYSASA